MSKVFVVWQKPSDMRVAFVSLYVDDQRTEGATRRIRRIAEGLAARGHDVTVCCSRWWQGSVSTFTQNDVAYIGLTEAKTPRAFALKLPFVLRRIAPDIIHATNSPPSQVIAAATAGIMIRTPLVVDWWQVDETDHPWVVRRAARAGSRHFTPSQLIKTDVRSVGGDTDSIIRLPESIDFELVRDADIHDRADIVYARRLDDESNIDSFLLALAELRNKQWRTAVIGDGPQRSDAEAMARDLRIDDRITFYGSMELEQFVSTLKGAHVFAQTASVEPFARELLWALACGCVGVVEYQARSSAHELLEDYERGARVTDPEGIAAEIESAAEINSSVIAESFSKYDHRAVLKQYEDQYVAVQSEFGWFS